jgi:hypothetical protein
MAPKWKRRRAAERVRGLRQDDLLARPWTPFVQCAPDPRSPSAALYRNSRSQVHVRRYAAIDGGPDLVHLSYKRHDQGIFIPYRDRMRLKDWFVGPECEAVELYPARSREVDGANQYHLWCIDDPTFRLPFGFARRLMTDGSGDGVAQEPWPPGERPADCLDQEQVLSLIKELERNGELE